MFHKPVAYLQRRTGGLTIILHPISMILLALPSGLSSELAFAQVDSNFGRDRPIVQRVRRPDFDSGANSPFFENLFRDGLNGDRPASKESGSLASDSRANSDTSANDSIGQPDWPTTVKAETLENEIKRLQQNLTLLVVNPVKYKADYTELRQAFSMLAVWFGVVQQYGEDVRWKDTAAAAQFVFYEAAMAARKPDLPGFRASQRRLQDLTDLVRGSRVNLMLPEGRTLVWAEAADRDTMMVRLQAAIDSLKKVGGNEKEFARETDTAFHESDLISAIAMVLVQPDMPEADDDEYSQFASAMHSAAHDAERAAVNEDFAAASSAINLIEQSCSNCHQAYR